MILIAIKHCWNLNFIFFKVHVQILINKPISPHDRIDYVKSIFVERLHGKCMGTFSLPKQVARKVHGKCILSIIEINLYFCSKFGLWLEFDL